MQEGDYETLAKIKLEKDSRVPDLQRANTVLQAIKRLEGELNLEEEDDLYDLAVTLVNIHRLATENEQVIVGAIRASQYSIRAIVQAMRKDQDRGLHRYTRNGNVVAMNGRLPCQRKNYRREIPLCPFRLSIILVRFFRG